MQVLLIFLETGIYSIFQPLQRLLHIVVPYYKALNRKRQPNKLLEPSKRVLIKTTFLGGHSHKNKNKKLTRLDWNVNAENSTTQFTQLD